ncbi:hypothetical protein ACJMK2_042509 [Sinanodonta woodiana]|uniref:methylcrotonoyl-CoA carboxylase n=1 Tax=Sinanodonta woodiana TaxID=1069815 RepID=A0ABD3W7K2_SINWO
MNTFRVLVTNSFAKTFQASCMQSVGSHRRHVFGTIQQRKSKPFPVLDGKVDTSAAAFQENAAVMEKLIGNYRNMLAMAQAGGGEKAIERHTVRNKKFLATDRVRLLLDDDDYFLELAPLAGLGMEYGDVARAGVYAGIGKVNNKYCMIIANDGSVKGGTVYPITLKKQLRAQEIAEQNRIPCVYVVDSGGAFLPLQAEIFPDKNQGGRSFYNEAIMSAKGIPQVAIVCGNCTAGGAYIPTMANEAVIIHKIGTIFLGGPPLVKAATGEIVSAEELGGAALHCSVSGCTDYYAETEEVGFEIGRDIIEGLNLPCHPGPQRQPQLPLYNPAELNGLIPARNQHQMDIYKVISRIVDESRFHEFKKTYGPSLVTGLAHIHGFLTGIVGNKGEITGPAAAKGAHFIQMCCERGIPLIFLQNTSESVAESSMNSGESFGNCLREHAKMMAVVSCAQVPKITVIIGNSIGPSNFLMGGRCTSPNFLFTWPNAVIGLSNTESLVQQIAQEKIPKNLNPLEYIAAESKIREKYQREMSAAYSSTRLLDDGMILPTDTRQVLGRCLDITSAYLKPVASSYPVIRM